MQEPTIHEKTIHLPNPTHPLKRILTSVFIYSAEYYPTLKQWTTDILTNPDLMSNGLSHLVETTEQMMQDLGREVIYGPSASHVAVSDRPHFEYLNRNFIRDEQSRQESIPKEQLDAALKKYGLIHQIPEGRLEQLLWYDRSRFMKMQKFLLKKPKDQVLKDLEIDGESWNRATPCPTLLLVLQQSIETLLDRLKQESPLKLHLLSGRLGFLHNKILNFPTKTLCSKTLASYRFYINGINKKQEQIGSLNNYIALILEYAYVLVFYYKYRECENIIEFAKELTHLEIQFTGKMGRRTKYQSFDTAQLVMSLKEKSQKEEKKEGNENENENDEQNQIDKDALQVPNAKELILKELEETSVKIKSEIETSGYDEESILMEVPTYIGEQNEKNQVSVQKILVTLCSIQYMYDTSPKDEILFQKIATSIQTVLENKESLSYSSLFNILLLRSLNQFPRIKNAERALDQFERLRENYNQKTEKDVSYLYSTSYLPNMEYIKVLAGKYMDLGMVMTAVELYQAVGMHEECIDGLIAKNYKQKASALVQKCLEESGKSPRLLCMMGDLTNDDSCIQLYEEAWELSERRNARSMRSLGWHYFRNKKIEKAAESFKNATEANHYHPNTWFTLGCCYMQINEYKKALPCFSECICIDDSQGEAWGNISTCYIYMNKLKEAYSTLEQATRLSENNWKLWTNLLSVSLKLKKFYKYFQCVERLVNLEKNELLTFEMLHKITNIFQYQQDTCEQRRLINTMKNRIDRLYTTLVKKVGQNPVVWRGIHEYNIELNNFVTENYKHYLKLHESGKIDPNDLIEGYGDAETIKQNVNNDLLVIRNNIVDSKQNELNMSMKIGWEENKSQSEEVEKIMREYIQVFQKYSTSKNEQKMNEFALFVKGVRAKLEKCLERNVKFQGL